MNSMRRLASDYASLRRILTTGDFVALLMATLTNGSAVLRTGRLTSVDYTMSRNLSIRFHGSKIAIPLADIDRELANANDNPTFGNIREMCGRDCYLDHLRLSPPVGVVFDLGANRGMFSLLALKALGAERVVGVEPQAKYEPVMQMLLAANNISPSRSVRYNRFIASKADEQRDPVRNVSIDTICREQGVDRIGMMKVDVEGFEKNIFAETDWLDRVDNIAMEVHPQMVGDLSLIPRALESHGFRYITTDQPGVPCEINQAMFLAASRTGALIS